MTKNLLIIVIGLGLALLAWSGIAESQTGSEVSFGIRPTRAFEGRPETFSYFSHELAPGAVLSDEALVMNRGDVPVTLTLRAADGITAINAGTGFAKEGEESTGASRGTGRWLSLSLTEVALAPGEEMAVPFTITVPPDASPGHHVAGLVATAPPVGQAPPSAESQGQFAVMVVQQVAVTVLIDVPGPHVAGLEITRTCLKEQSDLGATFEIDVRNTGNVLLKSGGSLVVMDLNGVQLASNPLRMETVLPGDATTFQATHPVRLADGDYLLNAVLDYGRQAAMVESAGALPPASIAGVEIKVKNGQPDPGCELEEQEKTRPPASITDLVPAPGADAGGPWWYVAAALLAVAMAVLGFFLWRRRRDGEPEGAQ